MRCGFENITPNTRSSSSQVDTSAQKENGEGRRPRRARQTRRHRSRGGGLPARAVSPALLLRLLPPPPVFAFSPFHTAKRFILRSNSAVIAAAPANKLSPV